jgi:formamidopyrimidine-DNA glycosylase
MPELPEVETVRQGLVPVLEGRRLQRVIARRGDLRFPLPKDFAERLTGRCVQKLTRRAKYILAHLDGDEILIIHLGMSGRFQIEGGELGRFLHNIQPEDSQGPGKHDHIEFITDQGARIVYSDHRRFGMMDLFPSSEMERYRFLAAIGPEPLSDAFSAGVLRERLEGKRAPIKAALLDQRVVAGLGNIYVCEALFRARISPQRECASLKMPAIVRLVDDIKQVLNDAIRAGGSTLRDYKQTSGELGYFQHNFLVYDRAGERCSRAGCKGTIKRIVQSGRSTFFCASCQR